MKKYFGISIFVISLLLIAVACTKEITEDIFDFNENFFTLQSNVEDSTVEVNELVNFTFEIQENEIPSIYTLSFSTNREGTFRFEGSTFSSGQSTIIEPGVHGFTYFPTDEGTHNVSFTVTNANETPLPLTEIYLIAVGDITNLETDFNVQVDSASDEIAVGETIILTLTIIEEVDVPESATYTVDFGSSANGVFVINEESFTNEGQVTVEENQQVFAFTPQEQGEYDIKLSVTSLFDQTSKCAPVIITATGGDTSQAPIITLNGENPLTLTVGDTYVEEATVSDDVDTNLQLDIEGVVDTSVAGEYTLTYNAIDSDGNRAEEQTRTINVVAAEPTLIETITISPQQFALAIDATQQLEVLFTPEVPTNTELNWTSNNPAIASVDQNGLVTAISFADEPVLITATAIDGSDVSGAVNVSVVEATSQQSEANDIITFSITGQVGNSIIDMIENTITVQVPFGTDITNVTPTISISPEATISPTGAQDFTVPVNYEVEAENGDQQEWIVTLQVQEDTSSDTNDIIQFTLSPTSGDGVIDTVNHTITVSVPFGTDVSSLEPVISISPGATINPTGAQDFSSAFEYVVEAENGDQQDWTVNVSIQDDTRSGENDILVFAIAEQLGDSTIDLENHTVGLLVPFGTDVSNLDAMIRVSVGASINDEGATNFTTPNTYVVTAENEVQQEWVITVEVEEDTRNGASDIISFVIDGQVGIIDDINQTVEIIVPFGTDFGNLMPDIELSPGATIFSVSEGIESDSSILFLYRIIAENGEGQGWDVTVNVSAAPDTAAPVITLLGADPVELTVGTDYEEQGATALDNIDGDLSSEITITGFVNTNIVDNYTITYNVEDAAGNVAIPVTRTVNVSVAPDTTAPVITLLGADPVELTVGTDYEEQGATALDNIDGDLSSEITITGFVNVNVVDSYVITYNVEDAAGNTAAPVTRTVNVNAVPDITPPLISLLGNNPLELTVGDVYEEPGAVAIDNIDGTFVVSATGITGFVNVNVVDSYVITYNVEDTAGNTAVPVTRTVNVNAVPDTTAPVITLLGADPIELTLGTVYEEPGAIAIDNIDGTFVVPTTGITGVIDTDTVGEYTITYNVEDAAGNSADAVIRTVNVIALPPVTSLNGSTGRFTGPAGSTYTITFSGGAEVGTVISLNGFRSTVTDISVNFTETFTIPSSGFVDINTSLISGVIFGGNTSLVHDESVESYTLTSGTGEFGVKFP